MTDIYTALHELKQLTASDFCAAAWTERSERIFRWQAAAGNRNERYLGIVFRSGQDVAGLAWKIGRPAILDVGTPDYERRRKESPIMIAEQLVAAAAIPVLSHEDVRAVLLVGSRSPRVYTQEDISSLTVHMIRYLTDQSFIP